MLYSDNSLIQVVESACKSVDCDHHFYTGDSSLWTKTGHWIWQSLDNRWGHVIDGHVLTSKLFIRVYRRKRFSINITPMLPFKICIEKIKTSYCLFLVNYIDFLSNNIGIPQTLKILKAIHSKNERFFRDLK